MVGNANENIACAGHCSKPGAVALTTAVNFSEMKTSCNSVETLVAFSIGSGIGMTIYDPVSIVGGVFNNSDILRLDYSTEYTVESSGEEGDGYLLALKARSGSVAYDHIEMVVDKKSVIPTEIRCYASSGILIKTLHYSKTKDFGGGIVRPSVLETDSPLQKGYRSVMLFAQIKAREFSDEVFTLSFLPKVEELR